MIECLYDIQSSLLREYTIEEIICNKLPNAFKDADYREFVYQTPADTIEKFVSDLHKFWITAKRSLAIAKTSVKSNAHFVDRRLVISNDIEHANRGLPNKCSVCVKPDCWATKHTTHQRLLAYRKSKYICSFVVFL